MILHIPHASTFIPPGDRPNFLLSDEDLATELLMSTDAFTDELYHYHGASLIVFPVSRLVVDPERFTDDQAEPMAAWGRGVVYTRTVSGKLLRDNPTHEEKIRFLNNWYFPHHQKLERLVEAELNANGRALIIDCHSFPLQPWKIEIDNRAYRPEFCIGTDPYHTPPALTEALVNFLKSRGRTVDVDQPYAGSIVPMKYFQNDRRVVSVMIEVRRDLYMNEASGMKNISFAACHQLVMDALQLIEASHFAD